MPRAVGAASRPRRARPPWALSEGARPLLFFQDWLDLALTSEHAEQPEGNLGTAPLAARSSGHRRGCGHLSAEAVPSSCRPGCTSGPRGFASASALLQPPSSPAGLGHVGREQRRRQAGVRDEPNFHRAKTGQFPCRRGSKASWLRLVEMTK